MSVIENTKTFQRKLLGCLIALSMRLKVIVNLKAFLFA